MTKFFTFVFIVIFAASFAAQSASADEVFKILSADDLVWHPVEGTGGVQVALIVGHPEQEGAYIIRAKFPPGVMSPPHWHDQERLVTVISGTWHFGMNASGTCKGTVPLAPGSFAVHPKGAIHYDGSCSGEVVVQISGPGPVVTELAEQH